MASSPAGATAPVSTRLTESFDAAAGDGADGSASTAVETGDVSVRVSVNVVYEAVPA